jgi:hypothetical protein
MREILDDYVMRALFIPELKHLIDPELADTTPAVDEQSALKWSYTNCNVDSKKLYDCGECGCCEVNPNDPTKYITVETSPYNCDYVWSRPMAEYLSLGFAPPVEPKDCTC